MKQKLKNWSKKWRSCWSISLKYANRKEWLRCMRWQRVRQTDGLSTESKRNQFSHSKASCHQTLSVQVGRREFILKDQRSSGNKGGTGNQINKGQLYLQD
jgi:hypothetical protein